MKKSDRIRDLVQQLGPTSDPALDPRYTGFFACFNERQYYEAHDILEDLWLEETGEDHELDRVLRRPSTLAPGACA